MNEELDVSFSVGFHSELLKLYLTPEKHTEAKKGENQVILHLKTVASFWNCIDFMMVTGCFIRIVTAKYEKVDLG